jgi:drug/metabolite transporter (DMT)-like permease
MLGEWLKPLAVVGVMIVVAGVYFTTPREDKFVNGKNPSNPGPSTPMGIRSTLFGLATSLCWAISPIFVRQALEDLPSPLLGVEIGMIACALCYGILLLVQREKTSEKSAPSREALILLTFGGIISAAAIWGRWAAIDLTSVAIVTTLSLFSVVVVMLLSPIIVGRKYENITPQAILGAVMIVGGSVILVLFQ